MSSIDHFPPPQGQNSVQTEQTQVEPNFYIPGESSRFSISDETSPINIELSISRTPSALPGRTALPRNTEYPKYKSLSLYNQEIEKHLEKECCFHTGQVKDMKEPVIYEKEGNTRAYFVVEYSELTKWWQTTGKIRHPIDRNPFDPSELRRLRPLEDKPQGEVASEHNET